MTYPPQPGQPGPYGQQPGGNPPPGGYPQQGGYPQHGGYPQQGGYPQSGGFPQQGQPQQGGFPQAGGYRQPGPYGQPGEGGYGQPPKKSNTGLIIGIAVSAVVAIGAFLVLAFWVPGFLTSEGPKDVAERAVTALNDRDPDATAEVGCGGSSGLTSEKIDEANEAKLQFTVSGDATENGSEATVPLEISGESRGIKVQLNGEITLKDEEDGWCVTAMDIDRPTAP